MQVSFAVLAADVSTAKQLSTRLSDSSGFTRYLATQNFPNVVVTAPPAVFDNSFSVVFSSAYLMSRPAIFPTTMLAIMTIAATLG